MFEKSMKIAASGLSVAVLALMASAAWADDEVVVIDEDDQLVLIADGEDGTTGGDEDGYDGNDDGLPVDEGEPGDWVDGPDSGVDDDGTVYDDPGVIPEESECGGCEYWTTSGEVTVLENARGDVVASRGSEWETDNGPDPFARGNICLDETMYVGWLCDWQRPYLNIAKP